jgi:hypothetical protein
LVTRAGWFFKSWSFASVRVRITKNSGCKRSRPAGHIAGGKTGVAGKNKSLLMAAVSDVPNVTGEKITVCTRHRFSLEVPFRLQKTAAKLSNAALKSGLLPVA